jgi:hypothetical protein
MNTGCANCGSHSRARRGAHCVKCSYWSSKVEKLRREIRGFSAEEKNARTLRFTLSWHRLRVALTVLEEYRWREDGRSADAVERDRIRCLIYTLMAASRSTAGEPVLRQLDRMSNRARKAMHEVVLSMVESLPYRRPALHLDAPHPSRRHFDGGWLKWGSHYWSLSRDEMDKFDRICLGEPQS